MGKKMERFDVGRALEIVEFWLRAGLAIVELVFNRIRDIRFWREEERRAQRMVDWSEMPGGFCNKQ